MKVKDIANALEELAPLPYAEDFDNVGLLVGSYDAEVSGVLITLDTLPDIVDEAISKKCNLIVSFHPIVFSGLKKLNGNNYVEKTVIKAVQNNIAIYAIHTALDNVYSGVSAAICDKLQLGKRKILLPKKNQIEKITFYVPIKEADYVRNAMFDAGAGLIGNYQSCSFNTPGKGTFMPVNGANPSVGEMGKVHQEDEIMISMIYTKEKRNEILKQLNAAHSYEEVAHEIVSIENPHQLIGMGMIGELDAPLNIEDFLVYLKEKMNTDCIRHSKINKSQTISRIAVLGGSGAFAIDMAKKSGADVYVSADFKYHDFFKGDDHFLLADIGHYESEQFTKNLLYEFLSKKFTNFAIILSNKSTNPIYYFK